MTVTGAVLTGTLGGLTWTAIRADDGGLSDNVAIYYAKAPAVPVQGAITASTPTATTTPSVGVVPFEVTNQNVSPIGATLTASNSLGGNLSGVPSSTSLVVAVSVDTRVTSLTTAAYTAPPSGHTKLVFNGDPYGLTSGGNKLVDCAVTYCDGSAAQNVTFSRTASGNPATVALEIKH